VSATECESEWLEARRAGGDRGGGVGSGGGGGGGGGGSSKLHVANLRNLSSSSTLKNTLMSEKVDDAPKMSKTSMTLKTSKKVAMAETSESGINR
jgi:hypothetical protein